MADAASVCFRTVSTRRASSRRFGGKDPVMNAQDAVLGYIKAYNAKDVSAMLTFFDEECVFENISGGKVTDRTKGKAELEGLARKSAEALATREQMVVSLTEGQGRIVAEIDYHAVLQADLSSELKAGSRLDLRGISVFEFADGKIVRLSDYS
jgi:steroid delta-isomerase-like uncharacterized protein